MADTKYYRLGKLASSFTDRDQKEEHQTLLPGMVVPLKETNAVLSAVGRQGLIITDKSAYDEYQKRAKSEKAKQTKADNAQAKKVGQVSNELLNKATQALDESKQNAIQAQQDKEAAEAVLTEAQELTASANKKVEEAAAVEVKNKELTDEVARLKKELAQANKGK